MDKKVVIYSTPWCRYCRATKDFLKQHAIAYTDINVEENHQAAREMINHSGQMGVPVIIISDGDHEQLIVGFDQPRLTQALALTT